jgi:gamma-glutamyltranspeptidase/glutathione hydrolase
MGPGKHTRLTPNPAMALKDGKLFMPFGSPGNDIQPQAMTQVFLNIVLFGMEPQAAVEAPRFATYSFPGSSEPHAYHPGRINVESRVDASVIERLADLGHKPGAWQPLEWRAGAVCLIRVNEANGLLEGAADPRRPCYALGI